MPSTEPASHPETAEVPVEPTEAMLAAFHEVIRILCEPDQWRASVLNDKEVWAATLSARPHAASPAGRLVDCECGERNEGMRDPYCRYCHGTGVYTEASPAAPDAGMDRALTRIADLVNPHWRGAGLKLTDSWLLNDIAALARDASEPDQKDFAALRAALDEAEARNLAIAEALADMEQALDGETGPLLSKLTRTQAKLALAEAALAEKDKRIGELETERADAARHTAKMYAEADVMIATAVRQAERISLLEIALRPFADLTEDRPSPSCYAVEHARALLSAAEKGSG